MSDKRYDVFGVGNALVDTEVRVPHEFLAQHGLERGVMGLVSHDEQARLLASINPGETVHAAGGSAANTMVGVARFGGRACYAGKVGGDENGRRYRESMREAGVDFEGAPADGPTGTCLVLVTPDGERTMRTNLAVSETLLPGDVDRQRLSDSRIVYVEGYLWTSVEPSTAALLAMDEAKRRGVPVAHTFSDPAIMRAFRDHFHAVTRDLVDIVFCNEHEARYYTGIEDRMGALESLGRDCGLVFMTCGGEGSYVWNNGSIAQVNPYRVSVVDTTGAGDAYAAGVLYGLTHGYAPPQAGMFGSYAAALVVSRMGPRIPYPLKDRVPAILKGAHPTAD